MHRSIRTSEYALNPDTKPESCFVHVPDVYLISTPEPKPQTTRVYKHRINIVTFSVKFICLALLVSTPVIATAGFRCASGQLASEGDTKFEIKIKCGKPLDEEDAGTLKKNKKHISVDRWTYNLGRGTLLKILDFHDGILVKIEDGPRM